MNLRNLLIVNAIIALGYGIGFVVAPGPVLTLVLIVTILRRLLTTEISQPQGTASNCTCLSIFRRINMVCCDQLPNIRD